MNPELPLVVSAGEALVDLVTTGVDTWRSHPGGAGWNVARAVAALGERAAFAGAVGRDVFGESIVAASRAAHLDLRFVQQYDVPTLLAVVYSTNPPAYAFMGENSADLHFDPLGLPGGWEHAARWVHLGGISLTRFPLSARLLTLARAAREAGARVSFDPNARNVHGDPAYRPVMEDTLRLSDLIKFSDEDLRFFFPDLREDDVIDWLRERNTHAPVVITRGADGASLYDDEGRHDVPTVSVTVADTVGAGDALVAGLLYADLRLGGSWLDALRFAMRVAAAAVARPGAHAPTLREVEALLS